MKLRYSPILLSLFACGGVADDEVEIHEKASDEIAALAGWQIQAERRASAHPLKHGINETIEVEGPSTARKMRLRFSSIRMEKDYDFLIIQDEWGNEIERVTGNHQNYVSRTIHARKAKIVLTTDDSVASWGFSLDQIRHRGCNPNPPGAVGLEAASSCNALRDGIRTVAINEVRRRFTDGYFQGPIRRLGGAEPAMAEAKAAAPAHSETNTQVAGVDEADIVKTDGNWIYAIAGHELRIFRSHPAAQSALVHRVPLEGFPKELFVANNRLIVLSGVQGDDPIGPIGPMPFVKMMPIWWRPEAFTKVTVLDFDGRGAPRVASETLLAGQYNTARRVGTAVRLVLQRELVWPQIQWWPEGVDASSADYERAVDQLEADAIQRVTDRALADWLPKSYRIVNGRRELLPIRCEDFVLPTGSDQVGLSSVVTIDVGSATPAVQDTSLLVRSEHVYQSQDAMVFSASHEWSCWEDSGNQGQFTYLHQLDVTNPLRSRYQGSGGVRGALLDQFSMDVHAGYLRVATTNTLWNVQPPAPQTSNKVFVLGLRGRNLEVVGETPEMAPGERIFSSRFVGDKGFVVTFRQVDPLFTLDLSNPRAPRIVGELKIPGFSTYLHVLDADHLFAVGNDFNEDGTTRNGVALTIFDVSDLAAPALAHKVVVGTTSGHSEALYDHKAFTIYRAPGATEDVIAIPFTDWTQPVGEATYWSGFTSTLKVFRASGAGITALGEIDLSDLFVQNQAQEWGWWYAPNVRRGVFVDQSVYAVSDAGLKVASLADLSDVVARVPAPPQLEEPAVVPQVSEAEGSAAPNLAIPDNRAAGISSTIRLDASFDVTRLTVDVNIKHTYRGDLTVTLEHAGVTETLHQKTGGNQDDLVRTFTTERFKGLAAGGDWTLRVVDSAAADVGTLVDWRVAAYGEGTGTVTPTPVSRSFEATSGAQVPDNNSVGVVSELEVPEGISIRELTVTVAIAHTYRGDLRVTLEHDGIVATLHDKAGGSADDLRASFPLSQWAGADARGTWRLRVVDTARQDVGRLESWSLDLSGDLR